jgi:Flp pilus assembly protein TadG
VNERRTRRGNRRRGSQVVEAALMFLPLFALVFLTIDTAWGLFVKATLQHAVQAGARCAAVSCVTGPVSTVQTQSLGLATTVNVTYTPSSDVNGVRFTAIQVTAPYTFSPLAPLFRSGAPTIDMTATAGEMQEPSSPQ